jgi:hypothetical protein
VQEGVAVFTAAYGYYNFIIGLNEVKIDTGSGNRLYELLFKCSVSLSGH